MRTCRWRQLLFFSLLISIGFVVDDVDLSARVWKASGGDGNTYGGGGRRWRGALGESVLESDIYAMREDASRGCQKIPHTAWIPVATALNGDPNPGNLLCGDRNRGQSSAEVSAGITSPSPEFFE
ncbi:hypothetical protein PIB30_021595 [Stylosanthes scabra]|uniref:Secreted protein n=1 Tax=Stylosanthes scabra TaxID=79078 RepID=A0ABU6V715_9FABA|nr:hypothetical protein [Stylosanthes scabra]